MRTGLFGAAQMRIVMARENGTPNARNLSAVRRGRQCARTGLHRHTHGAVLAEPFQTFTFSPVGASVYQLGSFGAARKELQVLSLTP